MQNRFKFLVLGHPRTGTGYMSKLFSHLGFDVGHEVFGKDGISNWMFAVNNIHHMPVWGTKVLRDDCQFEHVLMVVRNPYSAIKSIINTDNVIRKSLDYRLKYLYITIEDLNEVDAAIYIYDEWLKKIRSQFPNIKVIHLEQAKEELIEYLLSKGISPEIKHEQEPKNNYNTRNNKNTYREVDFTKISPRYNKILKAFCESYGYEHKPY